jgi:hypothetical protein
VLLQRVRTVFGQFSQLSRLRKPLFLLLVATDLVHNLKLKASFLRPLDAE